MAAGGLLVILLASACGGALGGAASPEVAACREFYDLVADSGSRAMTSEEMRERGDEVEDLAKAAGHPELEAGARILAQAIRAEDGNRLVDALQRLGSTCSEVLRAP